MTTCRARSSGGWTARARTASSGKRCSARSRRTSWPRTTRSSLAVSVVIFVFELDGVRVAHFGDFGQAALRPEQRAAIGDVDLVLIPVGGGFTIGAQEAARIVEELSPRWVVPMHY